MPLRLRRRGRIATTLVVTVALAVAVAAAILLRQDVRIDQSAQVSDVVFVDGGGGVAGFATIAVDTSGAGATVTLTGVSGAANLQVTSLLRLQNTDAGQAYTVTLKRSAVPPAAVTGLTFTVLDGATTVTTYDAVAAASGTGFTLPAATTFDIRIDIAVADGTAAGSLGSTDLRFEIVPV